MKQGNKRIRTHKCVYMCLLRLARINLPCESSFYLFFHFFGREFYALQRIPN